MKKILYLYFLCHFQVITAQQQPILIKDFCEGICKGLPYNSLPPLFFKNTLYFQTFDKNNERTSWEIDGKDEKLVKFPNLIKNNIPYFPTILNNVGDNFILKYENLDTLIWAYNIKTKQFKSLNHKGNLDYFKIANQYYYSDYQFFLNGSGKIKLYSLDSISMTSSAFWSVNIPEVADYHPIRGQSNKNKAYFAVLDSVDLNKVDIWQTDGTKTGTKMIKQKTHFYYWGSKGTNQFINFQGNTYFIASDSLVNTPSLFKINYDTDKVEKVANLPIREIFFHEYRLLVTNKKLFIFAPIDKILSVMRYDGKNIERVKTKKGVEIEAIDYGINKLWQIDDYIYFDANAKNSMGGNQLWRISNDDLQTELILNSLCYSKPAKLDNYLFFSGKENNIDSDTEIYLWKMNLKTLVKEKIFKAKVELFGALSNSLFLTYDDKDYGYEMFKIGLNTIQSSDLLLEQLNVTPNPFDDYITINSSDVENGLLSIFDIEGQKIIEVNIFQNKQKIDTNSLKPGIYIVRFQNKNIILSTKLIKI